MADTPGVAVTTFAAGIVGFTKTGITLAELSGGAVGVFIAVVIGTFAGTSGSSH